FSHARLVASTLDAVQTYLDRRLNVDRESDRTGNGLLVRGRNVVHRIGAALNTSFAVIEAAAKAHVDVLIVHHAPWAEIDLHLHEQKLARLHSFGISLYATHESLDRSPTESVGGSIAESLGLTNVSSTATDLVVGLAPDVSFDAWLRLVSNRLEAPVRAWPNNPKFHRVGLVPGGGGATRYLADALAQGCDTFLTGEGSLYTELFAFECDLSLVYATHVATEYPAICAFAASVSAALDLAFTAVPETKSITGGGRAPIEYDRDGAV
ncbi:MAG: Nif3-like dinuclear metal center hexameric protein, partial [Gemmatimonas sp.]